MKNLIHVKYFLVICVLIFSGKSNAQCLVNSIGINTGYDYSAGSIISVDSTDPLWNVSFLTSACASIPSTTVGLPYPAYAVWWPSATSSSWYGPSNSSWISFLPQYYIVTNSGNVYSMTLERKFGTCVSDIFTFDFNIGADDWVNDLRIDGVSQFSQAGAVSSNYTTYQHVNFSVSLSPGIHSMDVDVTNIDSNNSAANPFGLDIEGSITGTTNSIVDNSCPNTYCSPPICDFDYCFSTTNPTNVAMRAVYSYGFTYQWFIGGVLVWTGELFNYNFPGPGIYDVELVVTNPAGIMCDQHHEICLNAPSTNSPVGDAESDFTICQNTGNIGTYTISANNTTYPSSRYQWVTGSSFIFTPISSTINGNSITNTFYNGEYVLLYLPDSVYGGQLFTGKSWTEYQFCTPQYKTAPNTGIKKVSTNDEFTVGPNPATDLISIRFISNSSSSVHFSVRDMTGREILNCDRASGNTQDIQLSVANLPSGVYLLSANDGNSVQTKKFVKN